MEWDVSAFVMANFIIALASVLQMATGVSIGMLIVPLLAMISYTLVPVPIVLASLTLTTLMAYKGREHIDLHNAWDISVGMLIGIFIAVFVFVHLHTQYLGLLFGLLILLSVLISLRVKTFTLNRAINYAGGIVAGGMGAMAAVGGQVLALLFQNHPLESIKSTLAMLYTLFSITMLIIFYVFGQFDYGQFVSGIMMMPGFVIGFLIAPRFVHYFDPDHSRTVVLAMAVIGSLVLIGKSLAVAL